MALDPQERHLSLLAALRPEMRLREGESFAIWQEKARERLRALLGLPLETAPMDFRLLETREWEGGAVAHRFLFASEPGVDVNCQLLLPARARREKVPLVICLQGHSTGMHISLGEAKYPGDEATIAGGDRDFARQAVARGQAALAFDQRGFGERGGTPEGPACHPIAMQALLLGRTLIGERCWDVFRAIDATLAHFPQIDAQKIALMGNSGGGTTALYAAALDARIAAAMPSCAFCGFLPSIGAQRHCACNYVPGVAAQFDMGDIAGLIAPRPLVLVSGKHDGIFPLDSALEQAEIARSLYERAGAAHAFWHVIGQEGHRFYAREGWAAFDAITGWQGREG